MECIFTNFLLIGGHAKKILEAIDVTSPNASNYFFLETK